jgi:hypothetical protein
MNKKDGLIDLLLVCFIVMYYVLDPVVVAAAHVLRVELATLGQGSKPCQLVLEEGLGERETLLPGRARNHLVVKARRTPTLLVMHSGTAILDILYLKDALLGEDGDAVGLVVQLPLQLVADVPLGQGLERRRKAELRKMRSI